MNGLKLPPKDVSRRLFLDLNIVFVERIPAMSMFEREIAKHVSNQGKNQLFAVVSLNADKEGKIQQRIDQLFFLGYVQVDCFQRKNP